ncbi:MAG TPA: hypothetical protein VF862_01620 [Gemmatimonadales bacterium]
MRGPRLGLLAVLLAAPAAAQEDCYPGPESNEAKTLAILSVPLAFAPLRAPARPESGAVEVALEISAIPTIDSATRTPTICRPGKGPENTDLLFALFRPRVLVGLPGGLALDLSWIPPIRVNGVKANLVGLALGKTLGIGASVTVGLRAHGTFGEIRAPVTCPEEALEDPDSACYGGIESDDRYRPNIFGGDVTAALRLAGGTLRPYLGAGYNRLEPRFQVQFTNRAGELDDRKVIVDLDRGVIFGGLDWAASGRLALSGEVYAAPVDAVTGRIALRVGL